MSGIHPAAVVGPLVELGEGVTIAPGAVVTGVVRVGDGVWIGPNAAIGTPAQMRDGHHPGVGDEDPDSVGVEIGANTVVREFATVHQGTETATHVGSDTYVMAYAHVPHDAWIGDGCTLSNAVQIGGHTWIGDGANLGLGAVVHQRSVIGAHAMVGMQSAVTRPVPPFAMAVGVPARVVGANRVAVRRLGVSDTQADAWAEVVRDGLDDAEVPSWAEEATARFRRACDEATGAAGGG